MTQGVDINLRTASGTALHPGSATHPTTTDVAEYPPHDMPVGDLQVKKQRSLWGDAWRQFRKHKLAMAGLVLFIFMLLATFIGSSLYPQKIDQIDFSVSGTGVSLGHPFGTDSLGRDILARMLWGGRISLAVGGHMESPLDREALRQRLGELFALTGAPAPRRTGFRLPAWEWLRK